MSFVKNMQSYYSLSTNFLFSKPHHPLRSQQRLTSGGIHLHHSRYQQRLRRMDDPLRPPVGVREKHHVQHAGKVLQRHEQHELPFGRPAAMPALPQSCHRYPLPYPSRRLHRRDGTGCPHFFLHQLKGMHLRAQSQQFHLGGHFLLQTPVCLAFRVPFPCPARGRG